MEDPDELFAKMRAKDEISLKSYPAMKDILEQLADAWIDRPTKNYNEDKNVKRNRYVWIPVPPIYGFNLLLWYGTSHYLHEILGRDTSLRKYFYETDVKDKLVRVTLGTNSIHSSTQFQLSIDDDTGIFFKSGGNNFDIEDVDALQSAINSMIEKISSQ